MILNADDTGQKEDEVDEKDVTENQLSCQLLILTIIVILMIIPWMVLLVYM